MGVTDRDPGLQHTTSFIPAAMLHQLLLVSLLHMAAGSAVPPPCSTCRPLTFPPNNGRVMYLPFCVGGNTLDYCQALCTGLRMGPEEQGDCENCDSSCSAVFSPVCSTDQKTIYPNRCKAKCAGVEFVDCTNINTVIPGKSPLPPTHLLPERLQNFSPAAASDELV